ncbi:hypothetical protein GW17_00017462 [Ensete ventricosum]|nr:hypothetical protein GW17_00017462 [Ensete ventricosum]
MCILLGISCDSFLCFLFLFGFSLWIFVDCEGFRLVNAATGTGKTIVYLAPVVHLLQMYEPRVQRSDGTFGMLILLDICSCIGLLYNYLTKMIIALVLVPTRELCMQVHGVLQKLLHRFHWIVPGYIMGGENRGKEKARLRKGLNFLCLL